MYRYVIYTHIYTHIYIYIRIRAGLHPKTRALAAEAGAEDAREAQALLDNRKLI